jgi:hypothetical protein
MFGMGRVLWVTIFLAGSSWAQTGQTLALDDMKPLPIPPAKAVEKSPEDARLQEELAVRFVEFRKRNALPALKRLKTDDMHSYCAETEYSRYPSLHELGSRIDGASSIYAFEAPDPIQAVQDFEEAASQQKERPKFGDAKRFAIEVCALKTNPRSYRVVIGYWQSVLDEILDNLSIPLPRLL